MITKKFLLQNFGPHAFTNTLEGLKPEDIKILTNHIFSIKWYPEQTFINFIVNMDKILGKGDLKLCEDLGKFGARSGIPTFFRMFIRFGDPTFVLSNNAKLWSKIHDHGYTKVFITGKNSATYQIHEYKTPHKSMCSLLRGFCLETIKLCGGTNVSVKETACMNENSPFCEFQGNWE